MAMSIVMVVELEPLDESPMSMPPISISMPDMMIVVGSCFADRKLVAE